MRGLIRASEISYGVTLMKNEGSSFELGNCDSSQDVWWPRDQKHASNEHHFHGKVRMAVSLPR